jgi:plastocyanin
VVYGAAMRSSTWYRRSLSAMLAAGLLVTLGACSDDSGDDAGDDADATDPDDGDDGDDGSSGGGEIVISGFEFEGATAAAGATVAISNEDTTTHTVTSADDLFDTSVSGGESGEITAPSEPGEYEYRCAIHSSMQGTLVVE